MTSVMKKREEEIDLDTWENAESFVDDVTIREKTKQIPSIFFAVMLGNIPYPKKDLLCVERILVILSNIIRRNRHIQYQSCFLYFKEPKQKLSNELVASILRENIGASPMSTLFC